MEVVRVAEVLERGDAGVVLVEPVHDGLCGVARVALGAAAVVACADRVAAPREHVAEGNVDLLEAEAFELWYGSVRLEEESVGFHEAMSLHLISRSIALRFASTHRKMCEWRSGPVNGETR